MKWDEERFGREYDLDTYMLVAADDFNAGAMENAGCVTHNEYMVFREPPTDNQRRNRAETVLHEMAHGFLELYGALSERADAPAHVKENYAAALKWLGVSNRSEAALMASRKRRQN